MRHVLMGVLIVCLASCATGFTRWTKPGASAEVTERALGQCENAALATMRTERNVDADILASRGDDWQRSGTLITERTMMRTQDRAMASKLVEDCLADKGYLPAS
jgi:hypothetical protein